MAGKTAALFAAIYASPDDDAARSVLADHLLEVGDLRGELIALQLERFRTSSAASKREQQLLRKHAKVWLAPLKDVVAINTVEWQRGFPVAGRVSFGATARTATRRELATFHRLVLKDPRGSVMLAEKQEKVLVMQAPLRELHVIEGLSPSLLMAMAAARPAFSALERIVCGTAMGASNGPNQEARAVVLREQFAAAIARATGLPALSDLTFGWSEYLFDLPRHHGWLFESKLGRALHSFTTWQHHPLSELIIAWHRALRKHPSLRRVELGGAVLLRDAAGWNRVEATNKFRDVPTEIALARSKLPKKVAITLDGVVV